MAFSVLNFENIKHACEKGMFHKYIQLACVSVECHQGYLGVGRYLCSLDDGDFHDLVEHMEIAAACGEFKAADIHTQRIIMGISILCMILAYSEGGFEGDSDQLYILSKRLHICILLELSRRQEKIWLHHDQLSLLGSDHSQLIALFGQSIPS